MGRKGDDAMRRCCICAHPYRITAAWDELAPPHPNRLSACCPGTGRRGVKVGERGTLLEDLPKKKPKHRMMGGC